MRTPAARRGMVTSPHHLASQAGLDILKDGGTAIEAVVTMAATLATVYPHMTGLGGDGFWLIVQPDGRTIAIDACGALAMGADRAFYQGHTTIPWRGGLAANTAAGTIGGWEKALQISADIKSNLPLERLFRDAIYYAEEGRAVSSSEAALLRDKQVELSGNVHFAEQFYPGGKPLAEGSVQTMPQLGQTLRSLAQEGLRSFYKGDLARSIVEDLIACGSPVRSSDMEAYEAVVKEPLTVETRHGNFFNAAPPTQGVASLLILAIKDRLPLTQSSESAAAVHGLVEATKRAFQYRNRFVDGRPESDGNARAVLRDDTFLSELAAKIDMKTSLPWNEKTQWGDTTWMGAVDRNGLAVSFIQSVYFEFGSGVLLPKTGLIWQNRGCSFRLVDQGWNALTPGQKPFHTLNPAAARLRDGRVMVFGTMGGEGQPQTQAALINRYLSHGVGLQEAVSRPRWLLGRTWGEESTSLKIEPGFEEDVISELRQLGHDVEELGSYSDIMGHAGAVVLHKNGTMEGATDPRSDGAVAGW
ncbi:gamma-glutamyltranspeptidase [Neokomagataea thailandica NBRC 106555]|uniref:Gamma-glutamyltranspeptidase n=1 Tax=Neokomagataea thailandica NBRC 106555 TaxID=1223520 RepID=A0ABQ0QMQ2_9PROT|nr:gamma-glutamyltransferase family protein [Neokomagataea thailandica]GBR50721.1 gamma-glutamyltranspeptidase [Neokomagataea thailandica NBRC 106555]